MADYLIDQTPLFAIEYDLLKAVMFGSDARLGFLKLGTNGGYVSMIPGGLESGWMPRESTDPNASQTLYFDVLLLDPVTTQICDEAVALQVGNFVFTKELQTPWRGQTPAKWIFETSYSKHTPVTL